MRPRPSRLAAAALAIALAGAASVASAQPPFSAPPPPAAVEGARPELGLMGTIPLYWGESAGIAEVLGGGGEAHWARAPLEERFALRPLAALTQENLAGLDYLLLAQPRGLAPAENVALDGWVRGGGKLLLFADPMLTGESRFGIGDRRRPQDVILLSPILDHWGLHLQFDGQQVAGTFMREFAGTALPLNLPGRFATPVQGACTLEAQAVLAECAVGQGRALVLADAALLDLHEPAPQAPPALAALVERAFGGAREGAAVGQEARIWEDAGERATTPSGRADAALQDVEEALRSPP